jgi:hypothetical protein
LLQEWLIHSATEYQPVQLIGHIPFVAMPMVLVNRGEGNYSKAS